MSFTVATVPTDIVFASEKSDFARRALTDLGVAPNPRHQGQVGHVAPYTGYLVMPEPLNSAAMIPLVRPIEGDLESAGGGGSARPETPGLLWPRGS